MTNPEATQRNKVLLSTLRELEGAAIEGPDGVSLELVENKIDDAILELLRLREEFPHLVGTTT